MNVKKEMERRRGEAERGGKGCKNKKERMLLSYNLYFFSEK
jgi:hypothetical protein